MELPFEITDDMLTKLRQDVIQRSIGTTIEWFRAHRDSLLLLNPSQKNAAAFVAYLSQWVDMGYEDTAIVHELLRRFPKSSRAKLRLYDYMYLELAEGMVASAEEENEKAIARFNGVIMLAEAIEDRPLLSLAYFWKARCQRKTGEFDSALVSAKKGRDLALALGYPRIVAVIQVLMGWLLFQKEQLAEAVLNMKEAETVLLQTDDTVSLGNIQSGYGRIALGEGRYEQALDHFVRAMELYKERDPRHRNLARSLTNIAYVKRLTAIRLAQRFDAEANRRRKGEASEQNQQRAHASDRRQVSQLHADVLCHLSQAEMIYCALNHQRGRGTVHIERGLLFLDIGHIDRAEAEAISGYQLATEKQDNILMSRACVLQSMIETSKVDEGISEKPAAHAQRALDFARQALTYAQRTENRHLLARAYICQGLVLANEHFNNTDAARDYCDRAAQYLRPGIHDRLWEEHQILKGKVVSAGAVDLMLQKWSQGETEGQTFQHVLESFTDLVIPKVWELEGRKITRVAARLSVSPKKIRRILGRLGLKGE